MSKVVDVRSQEHFEQILRGSKVVLVDFWADWCEPCKVIAPHFEKLADKWTRPNTITFAKIEQDQNAQLSARHNVNTIPTIILFESGKETQRFKGSDISSLVKITDRFAEIASSSSSWTGNNLPRGYTDITHQVDQLGMELLNADSSLGSARTLFSEDKPSGVESAAEKGKGKASDGAGKSEIDWIESDTDAQLMLYIPFQSTVKVHSLQITSYAPRTEDDDDDDIPARPHRIELYSNRSHNLGFEEAEDITATQVIDIKPTDWDEKSKTAIVEMRFVKFQNISSLVVFVVDAEHDSEKTRIDRIRIIGESGEKRTMGKLQKIGDEPGE
ncbi:putative thioredoxin [Microthyrium microscopicum]|uniref:Putative thioredoxin n=1 Tax=Microthyrium microscopicum TaxID=703497 RepID=A0A6A6U143_9PEZI|nr:putative thioredoxin [Microthyrium microscopicum]